jgi:hypothetical protein
MYFELHVPSRQECSQFARQHTGIAAAAKYVAAVFGQKTSQSLFEILYFLDFINEQVVFHVGFQQAFHFPIEYFVVRNVLVRLQFLTDVNDVGGRRAFPYFPDDLEKDIAFPHTPLTCNDLNDFFVNEGSYALGVNGTRNEWSCL